MSCFDGVYKTGDVDQAVLDRQAAIRKSERSCSSCAGLADEFDDDDDGGQLNLTE